MILHLLHMCKEYWTVILVIIEAPIAQQTSATKHTTCFSRMELVAQGRFPPQMKIICSICSTQPGQDTPFTDFFYRTLVWNPCPVA